MEEEKINPMETTRGLKEEDINFIAERTSDLRERTSNFIIERTSDLREGTSNFREETGNIEEYNKKIDSIAKEMSNPNYSEKLSVLYSFCETKDNSFKKYIQDKSTSVANKQILELLRSIICFEENNYHLTETITVNNQNFIQSKKIFQNLDKTHTSYLIAFIVHRLNQSEKPKVEKILNRFAIIDEFVKEIILNKNDIQDKIITQISIVDENIPFFQSQEMLFSLIYKELQVNKFLNIEHFNHLDSEKKATFIALMTEDLDPDIIKAGELLSLNKHYFPKQYDRKITDSADMCLLSYRILGKKNRILMLYLGSFNEFGTYEQEALIILMLNSQDEELKSKAMELINKAIENFTRVENQNIDLNIQWTLNTGREDITNDVLSSIKKKMKETKNSELKAKLIYFMIQTRDLDLYQEQHQKKFEEHFNQLDSQLKGALLCWIWQDENIKNIKLITNYINNLKDEEKVLFILNLINDKYFSSFVANEGMIQNLFNTLQTKFQLEVIRSIAYTLEISKKEPETFKKFFIKALKLIDNNIKFLKYNNLTESEKKQLVEVKKYLIDTVLSNPSLMEAKELNNPDSMEAKLIDKCLKGLSEEEQAQCISCLCKKQSEQERPRKDIKDLISKYFKTFTEETQTGLREWISKESKKKPSFITNNLIILKQETQCQIFKKRILAKTDSYISHWSETNWLIKEYFTNLTSAQKTDIIESTLSKDMRNNFLPSLLTGHLRSLNPEDKKKLITMVSTVYTQELIVKVALEELTQEEYSLLFKNTGVKAIINIVKNFHVTVQKEIILPFLLNESLHKTFDANDYKKLYNFLEGAIAKKERNEIEKIMNNKEKNQHTGLKDEKQKKKTTEASKTEKDNSYENSNLPINAKGMLSKKINEKNK